MRRWTAAIWTLALMALPARAERVELRPSKDNTLYEDAEGRFSNGAGDYLFVGSTAKGAIRRALLAFDVAAAVPAGAAITRVELSLHMSRSIAPPQVIELHALRADWGEGDSHARAEEGAGAAAGPGEATWTHAFSDSLTWERAGGDFAPATSAEQSVGDVGFYTWSAPGLAADVQRWLDAPAENFGWILLGNEAEKTTSKRFDSRDHADEGARPVLRIDYELPLATTAAAQSWARLKGLRSPPSR